MAPATDIFGSDEKLGGLELVDDEMPTAGPHPTVSVVVPLYNEASTVGALYHQVAEALSGVSWEIVYVDDGSTDTSYAELVRTPRQRIRMSAWFACGGTSAKRRL